jgi:citrate synthase
LDVETEPLQLETSITFIDGQKGELRYRGYSIDDLVEAGVAFEEVALLLWEGELPSSVESTQLRADLVHERAHAWELVRETSNVPMDAHPLDSLRYALSWDALNNPLAWDNESGANRQKAIAFTAWFPVLTAALHRRKLGMEPIEPSQDSSTVANFLYMLLGREPSDVEVKTAATSFVLHEEHEFNASTFAARVTIATQSNLHGAIASALGTLAGPRHGGASDRVIRMLEEIGSADRVSEYVDRQLAAHQRIMGFGHRVYRTTDPRSRHLRRMSEQLLRGGEHEEWIAILDDLQNEMEVRKNLFPNVDLYAALVNHELGIDPSFYTSVFACARMPGWTAHAIEQLDERMIRPEGRYVGSPPSSLQPVSF